MKKLIAGLISGLAILAGSAMAEQPYPNRPITLVTPFAPGGGSDLVTRVLAEAFTKNLGQQVIVQNVSGAGGVIGSQHVANSPPDGYTLLLHHIGLATAPALYKKLTFDPLKSFADIGLFADTPMVIVSANGYPPHNIKELVAYVKKNKGKVTFASSGMGSATHLCAMLFQEVTGTNVTMIQYKGAAPALLDVQAGRVDLLCDVTAGIAKYVESGAVRGYVLTSSKRLAGLPDLPTAAEAGLDKLNVSAWYGLYAPAGTPQAVVDRLSTALQAATRDPKVAAQLEKMETTLFDATQATPAALHKKLSSQIDLWTPIIKQAAVNVD